MYKQIKGHNRKPVQVTKNMKNSCTNKEEINLCINK